eukprot:388455-Rhodomonas_salina.1
MQQQRQNHQQELQEQQPPEPQQAQQQQSREDGEQGHQDGKNVMLRWEFGSGKGATGRAYGGVRGACSA